MLQSLSANDTWKDSTIEQHLLLRPVGTDQAATSETAAYGYQKLGTLHTGVSADDETLSQQLRLLTPATENGDGIPLTLKEGETLVLEQHNTVKVKNGGFSVMVVRYGIKS